MIPKAVMIKRHLQRLRKEVIEQDDDLIAARIAYAMETAIRWTLEDTVGWPSLTEQARGEADFLRRQLAENETTQ